MGSIRFVQNVNLQVVFDNEKAMVPFSAGEIYDATKIEQDTDGYNNIYMPDGSVINGVAGEVFENMGKRVPVELVQSVESVEENAEIKVKEEEIEEIVLDGTMRSNDV